MKKAVCAMLAVLMIIAYIFIGNSDRQNMQILSCIGGDGDNHFVQRTAAMTELSEPQGESLRTKILYRLARMSIVRISMNEHAGSGLIWRMDSERLIIASNRHLLMEDTDADVIFCDGTHVQAKIFGYSQQYDIGFLYIETKEIPESVLRGINAVSPLLYDIEGSVQERNDFAGERIGTDIMQLGANLNEGGLLFAKGYIMAADFSSVFNCFMIQTKCYARAGMSGGGMFDENGQLIGMISGGDVSEDSSSRESGITYNLPAGTIENEYLAIVNELK